MSPRELLAGSSGHGVYEASGRQGERNKNWEEVQTRALGGQHQAAGRAPLLLSTRERPGVRLQSSSGTDHHRSPASTAPLPFRQTSRASRVGQPPHSLLSSSTQACTQATREYTRCRVARRALPPRNAVRMRKSSHALPWPAAQRSSELPASSARTSTRATRMYGRRPSSV